MDQTPQGSQPPEDKRLAEAGQAGRFRLLRYFTITTLVAFVAVGSALAVLQYLEGEFFEQVQHDQQRFFAQAQAELARQNEEAARANLLAIHEAGHVMLTRVVANMLWASNFAPFTAGAQQLPVEHCRAMPKGASDSAAGQARKACFAEVGQRIRALPAFKSLDAKAYATMRGTRVFKIKVWDLRGITVYSSEHLQIGEDGAENRGWRAAVTGHPASELTHRDRFSAFEGVVENRDLISTYVPVLDRDHGAIVGVVELYSDVTPLLEQMRAASRKFGEISAANEAQIRETAHANREKVDEGSARFLLIVGGLLALLYAASLLIVRIGQRIIDRQSLAQERAARREQLWHREKMAALAAMAANVSHEIGNPLAVIAGVAQQLPDTPTGSDTSELQPTRTILEQTDRIALMMRQLCEFASARSDVPEWVDINAMLKAVCDFFTFDQRFHGIRIDFRPGEQLPARELVPDHLNEVMMNLLQGCAECLAQQGLPLHILVATAVRADAIVVRIDCSAALATQATQPFFEARLEPARHRALQMGGRLSLIDGAVEIVLPAAASQ